ncbi:hypothetical protein B0H13DRAFT_2676082 [Mycena leptocephala]|nr:hypothetical protein B0H13DRAFT_2676082 [Mycena leptocephala]
MHHCRNINVGHHIARQLPPSRSRSRLPFGDVYCERPPHRRLLRRPQRLSIIKCDPMTPLYGPDSLHHVSRLPVAPAAVSSTRTPRAMCGEPTYPLHTLPYVLRDCDVAPNALYRSGRCATPTRSTPPRCISSHPALLAAGAPFDAGAPARRRRVFVHPDSLPLNPQPMPAAHRRSRCAPPAPYPAPTVSVLLQPRRLHHPICAIRQSSAEVRQHTLDTALRPSLVRRPAPPAAPAYAAVIRDRPQCVLRPHARHDHRLQHIRLNA